MNTQILSLGISLLVIAFGCTNTPKVIKSNSISNSTTESAGNWFTPTDTQIPEKGKIWFGVQTRFKKWIVKEIKTNRKCWDGRGHTNWSSEWCN